MVEGEAEAVGEILLDLPEPGAVVGDRLAGLGGGELGRGAVLVGGADEQHLVAAGAQVAGVDVGRELAADQVAEVLDPVDVGQRGGDEDAGHRGSRAERRAPEIGDPSGRRPEAGGGAARRGTMTITRHGHRRSRARSRALETRRESLGGGLRRCRLVEARLAPLLLTLPGRCSGRATLAPFAAVDRRRGDHASRQRRTTRPHERDACHAVRGRRWRARAGSPLPDRARKDVRWRLRRGAANFTAVTARSDHR